MAGSVRDVGDEIHILSFLAAKETVHGVNEHLDYVYVLPLVEAADVIGLCDFAIMEDGINGSCMVNYIQPVTYILALAIDRERLTVTDIVDEQRNELFRELIRAVVVGAVRHNGRHTEGIVEGTDKVIAAGFGSTVRTMRLVLQVLGEKLLTISQVVLTTAGLGGERRLNAFGMGHLQCTIDLVGGDVIEAFALIFLR